MENINYLSVLRDSFTLIILVVCSLLSCTVAFERWWFFRKARHRKVDDFLAHISGMLKEGKLDKALEYTAKTDSPVSRLFHYALRHNEMSKRDLKNSWPPSARKRNSTLSGSWECWGPWVTSRPS